MKNIDVVKNFLNRIAISNKNLSSTGSRLYSYSTCIAEFDKEGRLWYNDTKYSNTTSRHQYYVRYLGDIYGAVTDIPRGTYSIITKI